MSIPYEFKASELIEEGRCTHELLERIKKWTRTCTDFPEFSDEQLILFLFSCENDPEATKITIKSHLRIKREIPEMFRNMNPLSEAFTTATKAVWPCTIPTRTDRNEAIHIFQIQESSSEIFNMVDVFKMTYMTLALTQLKNPPDALIVIFDTKHLGFGHLRRFNFNVFRYYLQFIQDGVQVRVVALHIINANYAMTKLYAMIKYLIRGDILEKIILHPPGYDSDKFYAECVPKKCLPKDFGGDFPNVKQLRTVCIEQFKELTDFFKKEERFYLKDSY